MDSSVSFPTQYDEHKILAIYINDDLKISVFMDKQSVGSLL